VGGVKRSNATRRQRRSARLPVAAGGCRRPAARGGRRHLRRS